MASDVFDWQFSFGPTRDFFEGQADRAGLSLSAFRERLEKTLAAYVVGNFQGAQRGYDLAWFEERLQIGRTHDRIDLPVKWYIGAYVELRAALARHLARKIRRSKRLAEALSSIDKVINLDLQAVSDAYLLSIFDRAGPDLDRDGNRCG